MEPHEHESLADTWAHLNLHRFLLEIFHANLFRNMPNPQSELAKFREDLIDSAHHATFPSPPGLMDQMIHQKYIEAAEAFCQKVAQAMEE